MEENTKYYDVFGAFEKSQIIDWKQTNPNIDAGKYGIYRKCRL